MPGRRGIRRVYVLQYAIGCRVVVRECVSISGTVLAVSAALWQGAMDIRISRMPPQ